MLIHKAKAMEQTQEDITKGDHPGEKHHRFEEVIDRAAIEGEPALGHGEGVKRKSPEQQQIIHPIIPPKAFSPEKNGVNRAHTVKHNGQQEGMSISEPVHGDRLNWWSRGASGKCGAGRQNARTIARALSLPARTGCGHGEFFLGK